MTSEPPVFSASSDGQPPRREPVFNFPPAITVSVLILVALFLMQDYLLSDNASEAFIVSLAFSPVR